MFLRAKAVPLDPPGPGSQSLSGFGWCFYTDMKKTKVRLNESQSLSGFGWCFYVPGLNQSGGRYIRLNPFQGLVGVSTFSFFGSVEAPEKSQSLSGFGWCFYSIWMSQRLQNLCASQSLSGFGWCFYTKRIGC